MFQITHHRSINLGQLSSLGGQQPVYSADGVVTCCENCDDRHSVVGDNLLQWPSLSLSSGNLQQPTSSTCAVNSVADNNGVNVMGNKLSSCSCGPINRKSYRYEDSPWQMSCKRRDGHLLRYQPPDHPLIL